MKNTCSPVRTANSKFIFIHTFPPIFITYDKQNDVNPYKKGVLLEKAFVVPEFGGKESVFICDILCVYMRPTHVIAYSCFLKDIVCSRLSVTRKVETDSL